MTKWGCMKGTCWVATHPHCSLALNLQKISTAIQWCDCHCGRSRSCKRRQLKLWHSPAFGYAVLCPLLLYLIAHCTSTIFLLLFIDRRTKYSKVSITIISKVSITIIAIHKHFHECTHVLQLHHDEAQVQFANNNQTIQEINYLHFIYIPWSDTVTGRLFGPLKTPPQLAACTVKVYIWPSGSVHPVHA